MIHRKAKIGKLYYIVIIILFITACANPNNSEAVSDSSTTSNESEPVSEDVQVEKSWEPEPMHVYIIDDTMDPCEEAIIKYYVANDETDYNWILNQAHLICRSHNQEFPDEPRRAIGGGT